MQTVMAPLGAAKLHGGALATSKASRRGAQFIPFRSQPQCASSRLRWSLCAVPRAAETSAQARTAKENTAVKALPPVLQANRLASSLGDSSSSSSSASHSSHPTPSSSSSSSPSFLQRLSQPSSMPWALGLAAAVALAAAGAATAGPAAASAGAPLAAAFESLKVPGLIGDDQFREGLVSGFLLIFFSEIGDKTFFIALLLALKEDRCAVFTGTFGALAAMTVISVALGRAFHQIDELLPDMGVPLDDLLAVALLLFFGISTLKGAADADSKAVEEKEEADEVVAGMASAGATGALVLSTFSLVFAAEWGDKSFLATIALAAASDPAGVVAGAVLGHGAATGIAVAGGSLLSSVISEVTAQYIGGTLFLVFAGATIYDIVTGAH